MPKFGEEKSPRMFPLRFSSSYLSTDRAVSLGFLFSFLLISCGEPAAPPNGGTTGSGAVAGRALGPGGRGGSGPGAAVGGSMAVGGGNGGATSLGGSFAGGGAPGSAGVDGRTDAGTAGAGVSGGKSSNGVAGDSAGTGAGGGTSGVAGSVGSAGAGAGDEFAAGVNVSVHPQTSTILVVTWVQVKAAESTWLEFTFPGGSVMTSRPAEGAAGEHRDVVLGVPAATTVTVRIVSRQSGVDYETKDYLATTGAIPKGMPVPQVLAYDPSLASNDRWLFGSVENSDGGCTNTSCYYHTTFWLYIMDREGRIVWYYADAASNATSSFQRVARDGEYIWIEKRPFASGGTRSVLKMTLDREYSQSVPVPGLADCIDVTDDGSLLYDASNELREMDSKGTVRTIWSCTTQFGASFKCYSNTVDWNPTTDTVLMSFPDENTVVEIDRLTGALVGQYGDAPESYTFSPATWALEFQHFPNITPQGTLLLSSHMPGYSDGTTPIANQHAFMEFEIDRANRRLVEKWIYNEGPEWAMYKGMAIRLPNGNTLGNYGTGGVIREITPSKQTAFHVKFDVATGNDFFNKMVGNTVLIDDLYALNGGGPQ